MATFTLDGDLFPARIGTDRLDLAPAGPEAVDVHALYRACRDLDPAVTRYVPFDAHAHPMETREFLRKCAEDRAAGEKAHYLVRAPGHERAGMATLSAKWDRGVASPAVWLRRPAWGNGYAGELLDALAEVAFEGLDLGCLVVTHYDGNENSARAVERFVDRHGGRHEGLCRRFRATGDGPVDCHRYSLTRAEWTGQEEG